MNYRRTRVLPANPDKISRMDYSKHPHARVIGSVVVGVALLAGLYVWAFSAVG